MSTKIFIALVFTIIGFIIPQMLMPAISPMPLTICIAIAAIVGYFLGELIYSSSKTSPKTLRKKITYLGLIISVPIGLNIFLQGYLGVVFGPLIAIAGTVLSYIVGIILEKIDFRNTTV